MTPFDDADLVQRRAARLSPLLARADVPVPALAFPAERIAAAAVHRRVVRWRIAAAIALLMAGAAGVPPVRAWIVGTVRAAWTRVAGAPAPTVAATPAAASAEMTGAVTFAATDQLVVRIATRQERGGRLTLEAGPAGRVTAAMTGERNAAELLVGPDGLRIQNRRASSAGYVVTVPAGITRVIVRVGDEAARVYAGPDAGERFVVELGVRRPGADSLKQ